MKKTLAAIGVILLVLGSVTTGCPSNEGTNDGATEAPEVGKPAPDFQFQDVEGQATSLSELKGRTVLLNFWQTRCGPCAYEMPYLQQVHDEWQGKGLVLLAVNIGESPSQIAEFMQELGLSFPVLLDIEGSIAQRYNVRAIPTTFFIDNGGIIQEIKVGAFRSKAEIESSLSQLQ